MSMKLQSVLYGAAALFALLPILIFPELHEQTRVAGIIFSILGVLGISETFSINKRLQAKNRQSLGREAKLVFLGCWALLTLGGLGMVIQ
jgi:hypothetical protein